MEAIGSRVIINGKHVIYDGTQKSDHTLDSIVYGMMRISREKLISSALKTNAFVRWALGAEKRQLEQYYKGTINADLIHDWQTKESIYYG